MLADVEGQVEAASHAAGFVPTAVPAPPVVSLERTFLAGDTSATDARHALRRAFLGAVVESSLCDAELVLTELVANAVAASGDAAEVAVTVRQLVCGLLIEVADASESPPVRREASAWDEAGRGLHLVDELCLSWGWYPQASGKTVWALAPGAAGSEDDRSSSGV
ncbi:ATP-binding protein [Streptacidiphilus cavernicola]|uniref:ATP-binding protein n=1 Tax=Streptacidiphilus cavernicola TaxID=3342716 RepID=A0ABV6VVL2_9ACTN